MFTTSLATTMCMKVPGAAASLLPSPLPQIRFWIIVPFEIIPEQDYLRSERRGKYWMNARGKRLAERRLAPKCCRKSRRRPSRPCTKFTVSSGRVRMAPERPRRRRPTYWPFCTAFSGCTRCARFRGTSPRRWVTTG